jgi:hypothetical protein
MALMVRAGWMVRPRRMSMAVRMASSMAFLVQEDRAST